MPQGLFVGLAVSQADIEESFFPILYEPPQQVTIPLSFVFIIMSRFFQRIAQMPFTAGMYSAHG